MRVRSFYFIVWRKSENRRLRLIAAGAFLAALLALALPALLSGRATVAASKASAAVQAVRVAPVPADRRSDPSPFGYLEFDWETTVPGFDPWITEERRL